MLKRIRKFLTPKCCKKDYLGQYNIIKQIGEGSTAKVFQTQNISNGKFYTCKRFPKNKTRYAQRESHILRHRDNKYMPQFHKLYIDKTFAYLFTNYIDGKDLCDVFSQQMRGNIKTEVELKRVAREMLFCLNACHERHIQHLDVKLENFIVTGQNPIQLKIIDFGHAHYFFNSKRITVCGAVGTEGYVAPEIINSEFNETSDIWSFGICIWRLATRTIPFQYYDYTFPTREHSEKMEKMSTLLCSVFHSVFQICPEKRIKMSELMKHKWFDYS